MTLTSQCISVLRTKCTKIKCNVTVSRVLVLVDVLIMSTLICCVSSDVRVITVFDDSTHTVFGACKACEEINNEIHIPDPLLLMIL